MANLEKYTVERAPSPLGPDCGYWTLYMDGVEIAWTHKFRWEDQYVTIEGWLKHVLAMRKMDNEAYISDLKSITERLEFGTNVVNKIQATFA